MLLRRARDPPIFRSAATQDQATTQIRELTDQIVVTGTRGEPEFKLVDVLVALIGLANSKNATPDGVAFQSERSVLQRWLREAATTITCDLLTAIFLSTPNPTRGEWLLKIAAFIPSYSEQQREYRLHYNSTATFSRRKIRHCAPNAVSAGSFVIYHL